MILIAIHLVILPFILFNFANPMKWFDYLLSTRAMALLLLLMASAVGVATFIENSYDTITAKVLIYNAKWFELILFLLLINFINNIKTYQLLKWKKWSILMLHIGFIITLIGAFVTRYIGFEGVMLIQENTSSQQIFSSEPYMQIAVHDEVNQYLLDQQHYFSAVNTSYPSVSFDFPNKGQVDVKVLNRDVLFKYMETNLHHQFHQIVASF